MTDVFLVRRAQSASSSEGGDATRPVTPGGRARLRRLVRALRRLGVRVDRLYHSPLLRSIETAHALAPLVDGESMVTMRLCEPPSRELLAEITGERVAVVGHEPHLASLAAWLVDGDAARRTAFALEPAGLAWLTGELSPGGMRLRALVPSRVLRELVRRNK